jgi:hypothetical protein
MSEDGDHFDDSTTLTAWWPLLKDSAVEANSEEEYNLQ